MIGFRTLAKETQKSLMDYVRARTYFHTAKGPVAITKLDELVFQDVAEHFGERIDRDLIGDVVEWMVPQLTKLMAGVEHDDG